MPRCWIYWRRMGRRRKKGRERWRRIPLFYNSTQSQCFSWPGAHLLQPQSPKHLRSSFHFTKWRRCHPPCHTLRIDLDFTLSPSLSRSIPIPLPLLLSLALYFILSLSDSLSLFYSSSFTLSLFVSHSPTLSLSLPLSFCFRLHHSLSISHSICCCLFHPLTHSPPSSVTSTKTTTSWMLNTLPAFFYLQYVIWHHSREVNCLSNNATCQR